MSSQTKVEQVMGGHISTLGEGPHWEPRNKSLLTVDIVSKMVLRWCPETNNLEKAIFKDTVGAVVPCSKPDEYMVSVGTFLAHYHWTQKATRFVQMVEDNEKNRVKSGGSGNRFNDGKCDPKGRFWSGTMELDGNVFSSDRLAALYTLETDGSVQTRLTDVGLSNGLDWTQDGKTMYYVDSKDLNVTKFDYEGETGNITNRQVVIDEIKDGIPDGLTLDVDGNLWLALFGGSCVVQYDMRTGTRIRKIDFPVSNITSCCFGGANLDILYVTSDRSQKPDAGSVDGATFQVLNTGAKGVEAHVYRGITTP